MTCKFEDLGACAPVLGKRVTFGVAASLMATLVVASVSLLFSPPGSAAEIKADKASVERGRYLVQIGGCNDCHTAGYAEKAGNVPESEWLMGTPVGFQGAWGTSYAANLRLTLNSISEDQWVIFARVPRRPPMPWFNLRDMSDQDLRAMYRFVRELGPKGERAPAAAAPGVAVNTPVIVFEPRVATTASSNGTAR
jgi:mono/diheme cytochrome c family protein